MKKFKLNMFKTDFSLNEKHLNKEKFVELWNDNNLVNKLHRENKNNKEVFLLHDGPPYANGNLHLGHFTNKTLKDTLLRFKRLNGYYAPFLPGFDCHGLPVELAVEQAEKLDKKNVSNFLNGCRNYASSQVMLQKNEFKTFGVLGDWEKAYETKNQSFEAGEMELLLKMYNEGKLQNKLRPVHWCPSCGSSLAEAEVEYKKKKSDSLKVKFKVFEEDNVYLLVWTTTPYTLPANKAVAYNENFRYVKQFNAELNEYHVFLSENNSLEEYSLEDKVLVSPYTKELVKLLKADFVSRDGTGFVHLAPSFGTDDFKVGEQYNLSVEQYLDNTGKYLLKYNELGGKSLKEVNSFVLDKLTSEGLVFEHDYFEHDYPHCWRHKTPLFFKTSSEWFVDLTHDKNKVVEEVNNVSFFPSVGKDRLLAMLSTRQSWCVSRNRLWGVPLPLLLDECGNVHPNNAELVKTVLKEVEVYGVEAWHNYQPPQGFVKSSQTLDVWFDSGVTHELVVKKNFAQKADLYLEGTDQHRGWFQSSLLTSVSLFGEAPYKQVLTHGFVVDENGKKLSKSAKNYVALDKLFESYSPDVLRLWALSQDYQQDFKFSTNSLTQCFEKYKKFRNTFRFCLQNTQDFNFEETLKFTKSVKNFHNKNLLKELQQLVSKVSKKADQYEFSGLVNELFLFSDKVSALYFDMVKDTLYCDNPNSNKRKEVQAMLVVLLRTMLCLLSPFMPYSTEEVFQKLKKELGYFSYVSVCELTFADLEEFWLKEDFNNEALNTLSSFRKEMNKFLEDNLDFDVKSSEELSVELQLNKNLKESFRNLSNDELLDYFSVAEVYVNYVESDSCVTFNKTKKHKCPRCWKYQTNQENDLCERCEKEE